MGRTYRGQQRDLFKGRKPKSNSKKTWKEQKPTDDYNDPMGRDSMKDTSIDWQR